MKSNIFIYNDWFGVESGTKEVHNDFIKKQKCAGKSIELETAICECGNDTFKVGFGDHLLAVKCMRCGKEYIVAEDYI
jgi:hypothetical protein